MTADESGETGAGHDVAGAVARHVEDVGDDRPHDQQDQSETMLAVGVEKAVVPDEVGAIQSGVPVRSTPPAV